MHNHETETVWRRSTPRYTVECRVEPEWLPVDETMLPHLVEQVRNGTLPWLTVWLVLYQRQCACCGQQVELAREHIGGVMGDSDEHLRELRRELFAKARADAALTAAHA